MLFGNFNPLLAAILVVFAFLASAVGTYVTKGLKLDPRDDRNGNFMFAVRMLTPIAAVLCIMVAINIVIDTKAQTDGITLVLAMVLTGTVAAAACMASIAFFINFERPLLGMLYAVMSFAFFGTLCYPLANFATQHGHPKGAEVAAYLAVIAMAFAAATTASLATKLVQADKRQRQIV